MPGWSGNVPVIGPFRPILLHVPMPGAPLVRRTEMQVELRADGAGVVTLRLAGDRLDGSGAASVAACGHSAPLHRDGNDLHGRLVVPSPQLWWPHTHGEPVTHAVSARIGGCRVELGRIGFRQVTRCDAGGGFALRVNGVPVFCRGAVWAGIDPVALPVTAEALRPALLLARDAGFNMLRVSGMTVYESPAFFELCDELGVMVWQDFMFARFDYPANLAFIAEAQAEARTVLDDIQTHPSLAVLCGGTEVAQAASMAGRPAAEWHSPLFDQVLAAEARALRPDVPYVPHAPLGGPMEDAGPGLPFAAAAPIAHYFGVGGYLRPLADLDGAGVRFAAECLAFANPPDAASCRAMDAVPGGIAWQRGVARDLDASWSFEDVRDHYVESLFGASATALRRQDAAGWLDFGRAAVAILMERTLATWRTDGRCAGALVLMLQDLVPGAGWGVIGHDGRPKSAWHALRGVCRPVQVLLRDLGQNGIVLHAINETAAPRQVRLALRGLDPGGAVEMLGEAVLDLSPRESRAVPAMVLMGRWRDLAHAWRFGPIGFVVLGATLDDVVSGARLSDATYFPGGPALPAGEPALAARLRGSHRCWTVDVSTRGFAQFVQLDDDHYVAEDNHFHLWPGESRTVMLSPASHPDGDRGADGPQGTISALNARATIHYSLAA